MDKSYSEPAFLAKRSQDTAELNSLNSITNQNFEILTNLATEICDQLKLPDDPEKLLRTQHNKTALLRKDIRKLEVEIFKTESEIKLFKRIKKEKVIAIDSMKELIEECISAVHKLTLEKETMHKTVKNKHSALKEAMRFYKRNLDIYIKITEINTTKYEIKLCFFTSKLDDTYSVLLNKNEWSQWTFISAKPNIGKTQMLSLKQQLNETNNIVGFICMIKHIFNCLKTI